VSKLLRLGKIFHTAGRYRLDEFLPKSHVTLRWRLVLFPLNFYPRNTLPRGQRLRLALEELGPIFIKFGQLLSTRPDLLPLDLIEELNALQDRVKPFDVDQCKHIIETALAAKIEDRFARFDDSPLASASIAQVHSAALKDGREVVVKVVRPDIENVIEKDTALMRLLARFVEKFLRDGKRLRPVEIVDNYRGTIFDELDMMREAGNASQLRRHWQNTGKLYIPEVHWDLTRRNILVLERIYGVQVTDIAALKKNKANLKALGELGVEIFFTQVFEHNFFHADMHPGNVYVSLDNPDKPSYIGLDMAIIGSLTREDQYYLARNLLAMFRRDYRQVAELHVMSGWVPKGTSIAELEAAVRTVCEPIFQKPIKDISFGESLVTLFRTAQRFDMPVQPQLVLLQKTLVNIEGLGRQLYPDLDLWETAHPYLERWLKKRFHPRHLLKELAYHAPEWIEKFPEVPHLILDTAKEVKQLAEIAPELRTAAEKIGERQRFHLRLFKSIAVLALGLTAFLLYKDGIHLSRESLLVGALLLVVLIQG